MHSCLEVTVGDKGKLCLDADVCDESMATLEVANRPLRMQDKLEATVAKVGAY